MATASNVVATEKTTLEVDGESHTAAMPARRGGRRRGTVDELESKYPWGRDTTNKPTTKAECRELSEHMQLLKDEMKNYKKTSAFLKFGEQGYGLGFSGN